MLKKLASYLLAFLMLILSLGTVTGCVFDPEINVKRVNNDVYIYNGERYVYVEKMFNYVEDMSNSYQVGYAYDGLFRKMSAYGANIGVEQDVLMFRGSTYFNHQFYVKESISWPDTLEVKCTGFVGTAEPSGWKPILTEETFTLKEILSMDDYLDENTQREKWGLCYFTLLGYDSLWLNKMVEIDTNGDMYISMYKEDTSYPAVYYKVIDEEMKKLIAENIHMLDYSDN